MEPTNQPFRKENDLNQTYMIMCKMLISRGVFFELVMYPQGSWLTLWEWQWNLNIMRFVSVIEHPNHDLRI